ncbi:hypothetical protein MPEAHAMD_6842 [Methylobacterium frigidaeris]|uniref:Uncharacterized protein n=1 Tax=Methylobacterium frigidaeris TaxID=2038277 RepID=A0AA37HIX4_9HYPH|nr:hypothetical protein MPEAHAMD_6842 [Methylobacterium frigidaeris]
MAPRKVRHENINLTLPKGAKARMDAVLQQGECRLNMIRAAIDKEVAHREKAAPNPTEPKRDG